MDARWYPVGGRKGGNGDHVGRKWKIGARLAHRTNRRRHAPSVGHRRMHLHLVSGNYSIDREGNGTSSEQWTMGAANDSAHCTNFVPGRKFNGIQVGRQSAPPGVSNSTLFFDGKNRSYSVSVVDRGLAVAVCDRNAGE